ncbi:hypothetical protein ACLKA6_019705 [Drosophila palustris]
MYSNVSQLLVTDSQRLKAKAAASQHYGGSYRKSGNTGSNGGSGSGVGAGSDIAAAAAAFTTTSGYNYQRGGAAEERSFAATAATSALALASAVTDSVGEKSYHYNNNNTINNNNYQQKSNYTSANYNNQTQTNHLPYQHTTYASHNNNSNNNINNNNNSGIGNTMMMTKQKPTLSERLNIGDEVRELKLGATFNPKNTSTAFHTIKYDFKPASVDTSRMATVDVGSNNQVTVTVPNLESSGVPHTVYKGNHKKYTKECLIIFDKETGAITLEKLNHNIQVKKTRSEMTNKPSLMPANNAAPPSGPANGGPIVPSMGSAAGGSGSGSGAKLENSTMRITSKTKVSTGSRRNNIIDYKPRNSPMQQNQSSPSRPVASHRSPQSAPAWHANNAQQTLPSIPMIMDDDDFGMSAALHNGGHANISGSSTGSSGGQPDYASTHVGKQRQAPQGQGHAKRQQMTQRSSPPMQQQQQQQQQQHQNYGRGNNYNAQQPHTTTTTSSSL